MLAAKPNIAITLAGMEFNYTRIHTHAHTQTHSTTAIARVDAFVVAFWSKWFFFHISHLYKTCFCVSAN